MSGRGSVCSTGVVSVITVDASVGDGLEVEAVGFLGILGEDVVAGGSGLSCLRAAGSGSVISAVLEWAPAGDGGAGAAVAPARNWKSWGLGFEVKCLKRLGDSVDVLEVVYDRPEEGNQWLSDVVEQRHASLSRAKAQG